MALILPQGKQQYFSNAGLPLVGGKVYTYAAGTNTLKTTWADAASTAPNSNPVVLDARGEALIYWDAASGYKVQLRDALDNVIWTVDNVQATISNANTTGVTVVIGDGVTDNTSAVQAANAIGQPILFKGVSVISSPTTITVPIVDTLNQIFSAPSQITIANNLPVRPEWWGDVQNSIDYAITALPITGGIVQLEAKRYKPNNYVYDTGSGGKYISKDNVTIQGRKMPQLSSDCRTLVGGSIIEGSVLVYANNFCASDLGVDFGLNVVNAYATPAGEALICTYASAALKAANASRKGLRLNNVIGLCRNPTDPVHAVIAGEGYYDVTCTGEIVGVYGLHGVVVKCAQVKAEQFSAYLNGGEGVVIKSDAQTTAISTSVQISKIMTFANGQTSWAPYVLPITTTGASNFGVFFHAFANTVSRIELGEILESGHTVGIKTQFDGTFTIDSLKINTISTDGNADVGVWFSASMAAGAQFQRVQLGKIETRNAPTGVVFDWVSASTVKVNSIHAVNSTNAAIALTSSANPMIDTVTAENCGAAYQITSLAKPIVGKTILAGSTANYFQSAGSGLVPALSGSWVQVVGGDTFNVIPGSYGIVINGLVSGGASNVVATLPPFARPPTEKRLMLQGRSGATQSAIPAVISAAGVLTINDVAGGVANVSNYLSLAGFWYSLTN